MENKNLIKPTIQITLINVFGIIVAFLSQVIIAYYFGAEFERDAYFVAIIFPTYISSVLIGSIGIVLIPKVVDISKRGNEVELNKFVGSVLGLSLMILLLITFICMFFSVAVIHLVAPGYSDEQIFFTAEILKILAPTIIFTVLCNLLSSLYQIRQDFIRPAIAPILSSAISLVFVIILSKSIGIKGLAFGFLAGSFVSFLMVTPVLRNYHSGISINLRNNDLILFARTFFPLLLTGILFRSTGVVERMIASNLPPGSISYLGYSNQLLVALGTLTTNGVAVSTYPALSNLWSEKKLTDFSNYFSLIIRLILLISLPLALVIIFMGEEFIRIIFERGAFSAIDTSAVTIALQWSLGAFIFQGLGSVVAKVFYISGKTYGSSLIAVTELLIYFSLGFILSKTISFKGLAIALSISSFVNIFLSLLFIKNYLYKIDTGYLIKKILRILSVSIVTALSAYLIFHGINIFIGRIFGLGISMASGIIIYYFMCRSFGIEEITYLKKITNIILKR